MRDMLHIVTALLIALGTSSLTAQGQLLRRPDTRTPVDVPAAESNGIHRYSSKRLILYTDIESEQARELVKLVDQVDSAWELQFGKLPEARDKSEFQITGYLMRDPTKFQKSNLLRRKLSPIIHGQSDGYEFWMHDQEAEYYRAHLLLHEATHCVTQCREPDDDQKPIWFLEGMAEYFGSHQRSDAAAPQEKSLRFGVIPTSESVSHGFGRIEMIRAECQAGRALSAKDVLALGTEEFAESRTTPYAWSWALCTFLATHPETASDFRNVCHQWETAQFSKSFQEFWDTHQSVIAADWEIFRESLCYGFDLSRGATVRDQQALLAQGNTRKVTVQADHGWQSTGIRVLQGQSIRITATGRVTLAQTNKPWVSEPQGISVRYSEGKPMGRLLGAIQREQPAEAGAIRHWEFMDIGPGAEWKIPETGVLFLRVNDRWNELADNSGEYHVTVTNQD